MSKNITITKIIKIPKNINKWVSWLNDKIVTKYSSKRLQKHTIKSQKDFIKKKINSNQNLIFKIKYKNLFIGVLEISKIDFKTSTCEIFYMIGDKNHWGKGYGTEAIRIAIFYAKNRLKIKKVLAGINKKNIPSKKVLLKNKFKIKKKHKNNFFLERRI